MFSGESKLKWYSFRAQSQITPWGMGRWISSQAGNTTAVDAQALHAVPSPQVAAPEIERQAIGAEGANAFI